MQVKVYVPKIVEVPSEYLPALAKRAADSLGDRSHEVAATRGHLVRQAVQDGLLREFDDLVNQGKAVPDPEARLEVYKQAEKVIQGDVGYIPVVYRVDNYAFKPWVKDVPLNRQGFTVPDGNIFVQMMSKVAIEGREE